jgi:type IV secretion system protein TrbJ
MSPRRLVVLAGLALLTPGLRAQWAVFDVAALQQNITNYAALVEQLARQAEQIGNQIQQIRHMEDHLRRMGDMADVKAIVGFPEFHVDVRFPSKIRRWDETIVLVDGSGIFGDTRGGVFQPIDIEFPGFDGKPINRTPQIYKPTHEITVRVDNFREVQADVYERRADLRDAIARTSEALQAATTEAEAKKLEAILNAQYSQLGALDSEVLLTAAEIQVKAAESEAVFSAQEEADAEARGALARQEAEKLGDAFKPIYDSILRYVKEERFSP